MYAITPVITMLSIVVHILAPASVLESPFPDLHPYHMHVQSLPGFFVLATEPDPFYTKHLHITLTTSSLLATTGTAAADAWPGSAPSVQMSQQAFSHILSDLSVQNG